jgi:hypothetical protein
MKMVIVIHEKDLSDNESIVIGVADSVENAEKVIKEYYGEFKEIELTHEGDSNIEYIKVIEVKYPNDEVCKYQIMLEWFELNKA